MARAITFGSSAYTVAIKGLSQACLRGFLASEGSGLLCAGKALVKSRRISDLCEWRRIQDSLSLRQNNAPLPRPCDRIVKEPPLLVCVSSNLEWPKQDDSIEFTIFCKRTGRTLLLDLYAMEILRATGNQNLPGPGWSNLAVYVPEYQRRQIVKNKLFDLLAPYKAARIYREHLSEIGERAVMLFRPAMMPDIDGANLWPGARAIRSQWDGYLRDGPGAKLKADLEERKVPLESIHTSGHASITDLKRLAAAIASSALVPVHTFEGDRFPEYFGNVVRRKDGEWWEV